VHVRRSPAHRLFYYRAPRRRAHLAASGKRAVQDSGFIRAATSTRRIAENSPIIQDRRQMSGCPIERWFSRRVSDRRCKYRRRVRKTGLAGIGRKLDQRNAALFPAQSLPGRFFGRASSCFLPHFSKYPLAP
jgi:hypothetical protein